MLLANDLEQPGGRDIVLGDYQLGFELVVYQWIKGPAVIPGNVVHIAAVHVQHSQLIQLERRDPAHQP